MGTADLSLAARNDRTVGFADALSMRSDLKLCESRSTGVNELADEDDGDCEIVSSTRRKTGICKGCLPECLTSPSSHKLSERLSAHG